ncbi:LysR family transcriptional regulator [Colwellia psychrerythraea]|uniref:Transcriptional regulator, LysR family n=1 Tax=Colwellia psychrerythraea TaxID=28229 RepID=A0A099KL02_COLPS|nr:LysR family transcriptional regulator [Colwellia psychrerythraea]KGJ90950.1 transcriptional regulator, LysR family [Colwellia psychrerythraea]
MLNSKLLDGIVIFVEVINAGSFTKAADSTGHSTSYISKEVNKLEDRLGVRLINRTTRSISLTPEGELYFQQCQQIIDDAHQAESSVNQRQLEPKGVLRVSCPISFGMPHLKPILAKFLALYPKVNLDLNMTGRQVDVVADGFDVVIKTAAELEDSSLISRLLMKSHGVTVASPQYLKEHGTPQQPSELSQHKTITYSYAKTPNVWQYQSLTGEQVSVQLNSRMITNSPEMELELALAGQGITRMPRFNLSDKLASGELVTLFDDYKKNPINVYLVYASKKHMSAKVRCFIDFVIQEVAN